MIWYYKKKTDEWAYSKRRMPGIILVPLWTTLSAIQKIYELG